MKAATARIVGSAVLLVWFAASGGFAQSHSRRATELETKLFAPCCYIQTLDVHESDLADKLRAEIERRLSTGEAALSIEDDLVTRYGARIRAVPRDSDSRWHIPFVVGSALALGRGANGSKQTLRKVTVVRRARAASDCGCRCCV
jgi:cytochrome c-type biogenesis protein CcmH/NrfF